MFRKIIFSILKILIIIIFSGHLQVFIFLIQLPASLCHSPDYLPRSDDRKLNHIILMIDKNLWIGTGGNGLWLRDKNGSVKTCLQIGRFGMDDIKDIQMDDRNIWLATTNGVVVLDKKGNPDTTFHYKLTGFLITV